MDKESFCIDQCENEDIDTQKLEKDRHNMTWYNDYLTIACPK